MVNLELESKLEVSKDDFHLLLQQSKHAEHIQQLNVYYDSNRTLCKASATLRIRIKKQKGAKMTLKIPVSEKNGVRESVEVEASLRQVVPQKEVADINHLPQEFAVRLARFGIKSLERVGWMRTNRHVVCIAGKWPVELDEVVLPGGKRFYEVEVENSQASAQREIVGLVKNIALSARPSQCSKFERFMAALEHASLPKAEGGTSSL